MITILFTTISVRLSVLFQNSTIPIIENAFFLAIVNDSGL